MTTATTKVLATYEGYQLVQHVPCGEIRIEHPESQTCSLWLSQQHSDAIANDPTMMANWHCDEDMGDVE